MSGFAPPKNSILKTVDFTKETITADGREKPKLPEIYGYLMKLKHKESRWGDWTRRFFRTNVEKELLEYYDNDSAAKSSKRVPKLSIEMEKVKQVTAFDDLTFEVDASPDHVWVLRAPNKNAQKVWTEKLQKFLADRAEFRSWIVDELSNTKPTPPDLQGFMLKLKHKSSIWGSWTKRHFRVDQQRETLDYYTSAVATNPKHTINLLTLTSVQPFDKTTFELNCKAGSYLLRAESAEMMSTWFREFEHYIERLKVQESLKIGDAKFNPEDLVMTTSGDYEITGKLDISIENKVSPEKTVSMNLTNVVKEGIIPGFAPMGEDPGRE